MQYLFRLVCDEVEDFRRDILIDEDATFLELSQCILESCGYTDDQMTSFYLCNDEWERGEQITRMDMSDGSAADEDLYAMANTTLETLLSNGTSHLEYVFDPFAERSFSLLLREERAGSAAPEVLKSVGQAPQQLAELNLSDLNVSNTSLSSDFDDDFGSDSFNADELDFNGFEISEGDY